MATASLGPSARRGSGVARLTLFTLGRAAGASRGASPSFWARSTRPPRRFGGSSRSWRTCEHRTPSARKKNEEKKLTHRRNLGNTERYNFGAPLQMSGGLTVSPADPVLQRRTSPFTSRAWPASKPRSGKSAPTKSAAAIGPLGFPPRSRLRQVGVGTAAGAFRADAQDARVRLSRLRRQRVPRQPTRDDYAAAVLAAMTALGIGEAHICGLSLGGVVAIAMHAAAPDRCASLTLADTFAAHPQGQAIYDRSIAASHDMRGLAEARKWSVAGL